MARHHPHRHADPAAILAALPSDVDAVVVRDGTRTVVAALPSEVLAVEGERALAALDEVDRRGGWWAGWLAYDLGRSVEAVSPRAADVEALGVPDLVLGRFDARLVVERDGARLEGRGPGRDLLERALADAPAHPPPGPPALAGWRSSLGRRDFEAGVRAVVELVRAGECYQVNLTRRLSCDRPADTAALHAALAERNPAPHAATVHLPSLDLAVVSASPERFLRRDGRSVETRPIKGTGADPRALAASAKDRAENVMIVDLARNDLGRVCEYGSVAVPGLCEVEAHPGLHHLVSTVRGALRPSTTTAELLAATFPPASVTGAPKPRVLQAIEDLEPVGRGVYCGAVGWIDADRGALDLNVAIRTFTVAAGRTTFGVGGGIVADSDPAAEWAETELKAARLLETAGQGAVLAGIRP